MSHSTGQQSPHSNRVPSYLDALLPYPGSKRRLLPLIFALIATVLPRALWPTAVFADAFLGGGSVALTAKRLEFAQVLANDLATRSASVGRALIANSGTRLAELDVLGLFSAEPDAKAAGPFARLLPPVLAGAFGGAWAMAASFSEPRRSLAQLLLLKWLLRHFPHSLPSATDARRAATGELERLTPRRLEQYVRSQRRALDPAFLRRLVTEVNAGVCPGQGVVSQKDALAWLPGISPTVLYLDPPYAGTQAYERGFEPIDELLGDRRSASTFSGASPPLDDLLEASRHVPVLLLSFNNSRLDEAELRRVVDRHRAVTRLVSVPFPHYTPLAGALRRCRSREFLVLAAEEGVL